MKSMKQKQNEKIEKKIKIGHVSIIISLFALLISLVLCIILFIEERQFNAIKSDYFNHINGNNNSSNTNNDGKDGKDGINGENGEDGKDGKNGLNGKDGKTPELRNNNGTIQWKYKDDNEWQNLLTIGDASSIKGIVNYKKTFTSGSTNVSFSDATISIVGSPSIATNADAINLTAGHYYFISFTYSSFSGSSGRSNATLYKGSSAFATVSNYQNSTSDTPIDYYSNIIYSNGEDLKISVKPYWYGRTTFDIDLTVVDLG